MHSPFLSNPAAIPIGFDILSDPRVVPLLKHWKFLKMLQLKIVGNNILMLQDFLHRSQNLL